jgi:hypothetical protein
MLRGAGEHLLEEGFMAPHPSAEDWIAAVNEIVRLYRGTLGTSIGEMIGREEAVTRMRALGVADGDALRWLD